MVLPSSGAISFSDVQAEMGGSHPISMTEYYGVDTGIPSSGTISLSDFYGTEAAYGTIYRRLTGVSTTSSISVNTTIDASSNSGATDKTWVVWLWSLGSGGNVSVPSAPVVGGSALTLRASRTTYYSDDGSGSAIWASPVTPSSSLSVSWSAGAGNYTNSLNYACFVADGFDNSQTPFTYSTVGNFIGGNYSYAGSSTQHYASFGTNSRAKTSGSFSATGWDSGNIYFGTAADQKSIGTTSYNIGSNQTFCFFSLSYGNNNPL